MKPLTRDSLFASWFGTKTAKALTIVFWNSILEQQTGIGLQSMLGRMAREAFSTLEWWWTETYTKLVDSGKPISFEHYFFSTIDEQPWGREIVVIALTGYGQEKDRQRTREAGFGSHLVKPVDLGDLINLLTDLLDKKTKK
jgi:hypothetical protein